MSCPFPSLPPQAVEAAHRELLRSLGHSSSADTTPVGLPAPGMEGWSQRPHSPEGDSPLTRSLRSLQGHSTNIPGEQLHPISFPSGLHLPIPLITLLFAILLSYPSCPILS